MSETSADLGCVFVRGPHRDYQLSDALAWREGDLYVLRSTEFDVMAEDEDFDAAVDTFIARLTDYAIMLYELVETGDATTDEHELFHTLAGRLLPIGRDMDASERRRRPRARRRRGSRSGHWRHCGTRASGSAQLSAI